MPTYEFRCRKCEAHFDELVRSMSQPASARCPKCGSEDTSRELSVFAVGSASAPAPRAAGGCGRCFEPGGCGMD